MSTQIENIKINDQLTYAFSAGRVMIIRAGELVAVDPQASKAIMAAAYEVERLRLRLKPHARAVAHASQGVELSDVEIEGGKYRIMQDEFSTRVLRHGEPWLSDNLPLQNGEIELELPELWDEIARELRALRSAAAAIADQPAEER